MGLGDAQAGAGSPVRVGGVFGTAQIRELACEARIKTHEAACWTWMASKFPGKFSTWKLADRPAVRLLLTKNAAPFEDSAKWLVPAMAFGPDIWLPADPHGWFLQLANWPRHRRFTATAARSLETAEARQQGGADPLRCLPISSLEATRDSSPDGR